MKLLPYFILLSTYLFSTAIYSQDIEFTTEEKQWIKDHPIIHHGYEPNWPPYEIYKDGIYTGIVGDYISIIENKTGIDFIPIDNLTWKDALEKLKAGEIKVVPCAGITDEREEYLFFTEPYIDDPLIIVTRKDYNFISGIEDLTGRPISLPENYYTIELIKSDYPNFNIIEYESFEKSLEALSIGETDAFIGSLGVVNYYINHHGFTNLKIAAPTPYNTTKIGFAVTKDWEILRDIVQKVFDQISQKEKNEIRENWISVQYEHSYNNSLLVKILIYVLAPLFVLMLLVFLWNRSLKKQVKKRIQTEKELESVLANVNEQNKEKEALLNEIHHRVKNNLQIVSSILKLHSNKSQNKDVIDSISEAGDRVYSIARIHEMIYNTSNLGEVEIKKYINSLATELVQLYDESKTSISFSVESDIQFVNTKTIVPLALIFNELITNSLKYAFIGKNNGVIEIKINTTENGLKIIYLDNGTWKTPSKDSGFGESLVEIFTESLDGVYVRNTENGTHYLFDIKLT